MKPANFIRILIVEDDPSDLELVRDLFGTTSCAAFEVNHASTLAGALGLLRDNPFDVVLLDLGLPDSNGVETFVQLHKAAPEVPVLVFNGNDEDSVGLAAMEEGAQDLVVKKRVQKRLVENAVRYAVIRTRVEKREAQERQHDEQKRELSGMERLSAGSGTTVTARIYSGSPLRESAPDEFKSAVAEYYDLLQLALEQRIFKDGRDFSDRLRELGQQLGFLRAGPRDVVDIHTTALRRRMENVPAEKAQAYIEEGRIAGLELMGHLTGYYRSFYPAAKNKGKQA